VEELLPMTIEERTELRKKRIVVNVARSHDEAEAWDLEFWLAMTPQERLSALVAIRRDVEKVLAARGDEPGDPVGG
jgi:hypothetical protein